MKNAIIIGATGFGGLGLIDLLSKHPEIKVSELAAIDHGKKISEMYPHLRGICDLEVLPPDSIGAGSADIVFLSTPDQVGMNLAKKFHEANIPVIDFSGDFRFHSLEDYSVYAKNKGMSDVHSSPGLLKESVYGLPEKYADRIRTAPIIGNPGCFAMAMILALLPAAEEGLISGGTLVCDGKTGVSGAGINPGRANSYPLRYENCNTYREGKHQHLVEVENVINSVKKNMETRHNIFFVPQIIPMNRGILVTVYADAVAGTTGKSVADFYKNYYHNSHFVHIIDYSPNTSEVRGTNCCNIRATYDERTGKLLIVSVLDNLLKGQSGNAVQNANIRLGFDETAGLTLNPIYP